MAFEDFLRSIPLIHKHIMRTRLLMHENAKFRKFVKHNGLNVSDVLSGNFQELNLSSQSLNEDIDSSEITVQALTESLRMEQKRATKLEGDLYVLQIDYDNLIKHSQFKI